MKIKKDHEENHKSGKIQIKKSKEYKNSTPIKQLKNKHPCPTGDCFYSFRDNQKINTPAQQMIIFIPLETQQMIVFIPLETIKI